MAGAHWTDEENDLIVVDYFAMLAEDVAGGSLNKTEHRKVLQERLNGRSGQSIEFKHRNISAVLQVLGESWLTGYKPAVNFQASLARAVVRWLARNPEWLAPLPSLRPATGLHQDATIRIFPPPTLSNRPPPKTLQTALRIGLEFDVADRHERNRALGRAGEERVLAHERASLRSKGRDDLASKVRWVSEEDGDGAGYDLASFEPDGRARLLEVKTTNGWQWTPFHITRKERAVSDERRSEWCLFRLWNFSREPKAFELRPPLDAHVTLTPTACVAHFR